MAVTSPHILYVGTSAYDLRKVTYWQPVDNVAPAVSRVRFVNLDSYVDILQSTFEAAKQASLDGGG